MSVPVVGMAIARELSALLNQNGSDALQKMFESGPSHRPASCIGILPEESDSEDNMDVEPDTVPTLAYVFILCWSSGIMGMGHWHSHGILHISMCSVQVSGDHGGSASVDRELLSKEDESDSSGSSSDKSATVSDSSMQCASRAAGRHREYRAGAASSSDSSDSDSSESSSDSATASSSAMQQCAPAAAGAASAGDDSDSDVIMSHPAC